LQLYPHILRADVASCLACSHKPIFARMIFCSLVIYYVLLTTPKPAQRKAPTNGAFTRTLLGRKPTRLFTIIPPTTSPDVLTGHAPACLLVSAEKFTFGSGESVRYQQTFSSCCSFGPDSFYVWRHVIHAESACPCAISLTQNKRKIDEYCAQRDKQDRFRAQCTARGRCANRHC
jgi:hypothetical protein